MALNPASRNRSKPGFSPLRSQTASRPSHEIVAPLHIQHLRDVAAWASSAVPPLGANLGFRLGASCEALGCPLPCENRFSCERCESILHVGTNCSVRVKPWKGLRSSRSVNQIVYFCHYCSYENRKSGTQNAYIKGKLIDVTGCIGISTSETVRSTKSVACYDGQTSTKVVSSGSTAKKRKRKGWLTLKELAASSLESFDSNRASLFVKEVVKFPESSEFRKSPMAAGPLASVVHPLSIEDDTSDVAAEQLRLLTMASRQSVSSDGTVPLPDHNDTEYDVSGQSRIATDTSDRYAVDIKDNGHCPADEGPVSTNKNEHDNDEFTDGCMVDGVDQTELENLDLHTVGSNLFGVPVSADTLMSENPKHENYLDSCQHDIGFSSDKEVDIFGLKSQGLARKGNLKAGASIKPDLCEFCVMVVKEDEHHRETCPSELQSIEYVIGENEAVKANDIAVKDNVKAMLDGHLQTEEQHSPKSEFEDSMEVENVNGSQSAAANRENIIDHLISDTKRVEFVELSKPQLQEMDNVTSDNVNGEESNLHSLTCAKVSEFCGKDHAVACQGECSNAVQVDPVLGSRSAQYPPSDVITVERVNFGTVLSENIDGNENKDTNVLEKTRVEMEGALSIIRSTVSPLVSQDKVLQSLEQVLSNISETLAVKKQNTELLIDLQQSVRKLDKLQKLVASDNVIEQKLSVLDAKYSAIEQKLSVLDAKYSAIEQKLSEITNIRNEINCLSTKVSDIANTVLQLREVLAESVVSKLDQRLDWKMNVSQMREENADLSRGLVGIHISRTDQLESPKIYDQLRLERAKKYDQLGENVKQLNEHVLGDSQRTCSTDKVDSRHTSLLQIEDSCVVSKKRCNGDAMDEGRPSKQERHHKEYGTYAEKNAKDKTSISNKATNVKNRKKPVFTRIGRHWFQFYYEKEGKSNWRMI